MDLYRGTVEWRFLRGGDGVTKTDEISVSLEHELGHELELLPTTLKSCYVTIIYTSRKTAHFDLTMNCQFSFRTNEIGLKQHYQALGNYYVYPRRLINVIITYEHFLK